LLKVIDLPAMDKERFQQMDKWLHKQAEATRAMNKTLNKFIAIMGNQEVARNVAPPPLVSPPHVTTTLQASQPSRVKTGRCLSGDTGGSADASEYPRKRLV
jgi:hypothetical protein